MNSRRYFNRVALLLLAGLVAGLSRPAPALGAAFGIHPTRQEFTLKPGAFKRYRFRVQSSEQRMPIEVKYYVADVKVAADGSVDIVPPGTTSWSAAPWIKLARKRVRLRPQAHAFLLYEIRVPQGAQGGRYACIVSETVLPSSASSRGVVRVNMRVPYLVFITVRGTEVCQAEVVSLTCSTNRTKEPVRCSVIIKNTGNVLIRPRGDLELAGATEAGRGRINPRKFALLPGVSRRFTVDLSSDVKEPGEYRLDPVMILAEAASSQ